MKKIISFLIVLILVLQLSVVCIPVSAANSSVANLEVSTENVFAGDAVYVTVYLTSNPGLTYIKLKMSYDTNALTLFGVQNGDIIEDLTRGSSYVWSATNTTISTGTFATLIFSVSTDASAGIYPVTITCVEAYNNENDVSVNIQNGSVIVNAEECVHDMESISYKAPTCEATGSRVLKCTKCDYSETVTFDKVDCVAESDADCINDAECKYCGDVLESAYGHKYRTQVIDPTSTDEGYTLHTCMRCGDSYKDTVLPPVDDSISVTGVTLNKASGTLKLGDNVSLMANVTPSNATNKNVTWRSSNSTVASVVNGVVTANKAGSATITATTEDGGFVATCIVTVIEPEPDNIPVTGITLSESAVTLKEGDKQWIEATVLPYDATNKLVNWTCSDPTIADIAWSGDNNSRGLIVSRSAGTAVITASTADGSFMAQCTVTVIDDDTPVDPNAPAISIDNVTSSAGKTVEVNIALKNNPGILGASFTLSYSEELTLISAQKGEALSSLTYTAPGELSNPCRFGWDGVDESDADGVVLTLTFKVPDNAKQGDSYAINISYDNGSIFDNSMNAINFSIESGSIKIPEYVSGDLNDDGIINMQDVVLLRRHIIGGYNVVINDLAADVNRDGLLNMQDVVLIRRYIVGGYGVELK